MSKEKKQIKMSQQAYDALAEELNQIKTVREQEIAELIKEARGFGDLSENSEYDEAKNEQGKLNSRKREIEEILANAVIIDESTLPSDTVGIGSVITVTELPGGETLPEFKIVGSQEADAMNRFISEESPFGKAMMGKKEGDEVVVEAPVGAIHYRIEKIGR